MAYYLHIKSKVCNYQAGWLKKAKLVWGGEVLPSKTNRQV